MTEDILLILHQNSTSGGFLKAAYSVESEGIPVKFASSVTLESIGQSCTLVDLFGRDDF